MAENIIVDDKATKSEKYETLLPQILALVSYEENRIANQANALAALKSVFDFFWIGFYWVHEDELVLGPFQGPVACTRIGFGKGVCGASWKQNRTLVVPNVEDFPGHIACSSLSKSEVVVPIRFHDKVVGVLDVDSEHLAFFDNTDAFWLEKIFKEITPFLV